MPLPRDLDTLRIPAFMRKRSLRARLKKPLILTALDRKKSGITVIKKEKGPKQKAPRKRKVLQKPQETFSAPLLDFYAESFTKPSVSAKKSKSIRPSRSNDASASCRLHRRLPLPMRPKGATIGTITHYYNKIHVGVIKLSGSLTVGDCITYETDEGSYKQVIESIEINREPVFKAGRGKEIGLKLRKIPRVGSAVLK